MSSLFQIHRKQRAKVLTFKFQLRKDPKCGTFSKYMLTILEYHFQQRHTSGFPGVLLVTCPPSNYLQEHLPALKRIIEGLVKDLAARKDYPHLKLASHGTIVEGQRISRRVATCALTNQPICTTCVSGALTGTERQKFLGDMELHEIDIVLQIKMLGRSADYPFITGVANMGEITSYASSFQGNGRAARIVSGADDRTWTRPEYGPFLSSAGFQRADATHPRGSQPIQEAFIYELDLCAPMHQDKHLQKFLQEERAEELIDVIDLLVGDPGSPEPVDVDGDLAADLQPTDAAADGDVPDNQQSEQLLVMGLEAFEAAVPFVVGDALHMDMTVSLAQDYGQAQYSDRLGCIVVEKPTFFFQGQTTIFGDRQLTNLTDGRTDSTSGMYTVQENRDRNLNNRIERVRVVLCKDNGEALCCTKWKEVPVHSPEPGPSPAGDDDANDDNDETADQQQEQEQGGVADELEEEEEEVVVVEEVVEEQQGQEGGNELEDGEGEGEDSPGTHARAVPPRSRKRCEAVQEHQPSEDDTEDEEYQPSSEDDTEDEEYQPSNEDESEDDGAKSNDDPPGSEGDGDSQGNDDDGAGTSAPRARKRRRRVVAVEDIGTGTGFTTNVVEVTPTGELTTRQDPRRTSQVGSASEPTPELVRHALGALLAAPGDELSSTELEEHMFSQIPRRPVPAHGVRDAMGQVWQRLQDYPQGDHRRNLEAFLRHEYGHGSGEQYVNGERNPVWDASHAFNNIVNNVDRATAAYGLRVINNRYGESTHALIGAVGSQYPPEQVSGIIERVRSAIFQLRSDPRYLTNNGQLVRNITRDYHALYVEDGRMWRCVPVEQPLSSGDMPSEEEEEERDGDSLDSDRHDPSYTGDSDGEAEDSIED